MVSPSNWSFTDRQQSGRETDDVNSDRTQELVVYR
jgi:hypothetical protein